MKEGKKISPIAIVAGSISAGAAFWGAANWNYEKAGNFGPGDRSNPSLSEKSGGPRLTDQSIKSGDSPNNTGDGKMIESKGGADEQGKKWKFWDDDDDIDPTGSAPNERVSHGWGSEDLVDPDFDAYVAVLGVVAVLAVFALGVAMNNNRGRTANAGA